MVKSISILGSTGSIGRQTVAAARHLGIRVAAIAANRSVRELEAQARELLPDIVGVTDEGAFREVRTLLADTPVRVVGGREALMECAMAEKADCVVTAVSGSVGLAPTLGAISAKKRIALANKETLVCAGDMVMQAARDCGAEIIPVDSEHSAIFQSLTGRASGEVRRILLTASGGPFRGMKYAEVYGKTPAEALRHPNWSMGAKITVDSATMMNKGLELIEAMHLFSVSPEDIEILIHPQSVVHSGVELTDGAVIAQLGAPDMELPIQYALTYPDRAPSLARRLDLFGVGTLTFERPDLDELPCLRLAMDSARRGGTAPCVMSAANEEAVGLFLREKIPFGRIYECAAASLDSIEIIERPALEDIFASDAAARAFVKRNFG